MTDAEKMRAAAAQLCADEADRCEDAAQWSGHRKYVQDCKAAAFALRIAGRKIRILPLPEPTEARVKAAAPYMSTVQNADPGRRLNPFDDLITALGFNENQSTMSDKPTEALVAAERALWVQAIETYFDATAVMDVEKHVERLRAEGRGGDDMTAPCSVCHGAGLIWHSPDHARPCDACCPHDRTYQQGPHHPNPGALTCAHCGKEMG